MIPPKDKAYDALRKLKEQYPKEGPEELAVRFKALMESDEALKEDMLRLAFKMMIDEEFKMMIDEEYDEAARHRRPFVGLALKPDY
jgi:hypothetical protein